jgi:phosphatidate cytidylyltransferase
MKRVLTAAVLAPVVLLLVFRAPLWLFAPIIALIIALALREYLAIVEAAGSKPFHWPTYVFGLLPIAALLAVKLPLLWHPSRQEPPDLPYASDLWPIWAGCCVIAPVVYGACLVFRRELRGGGASVATSLFGLLYVAVPISLFLDLRDDPSRRFLLVFILFSVWAGDIAAYYIGKNFGKRKLAPIVSPNKSWEGAIASAVASVGIAALIFRFDYWIAGLFTSESGLWHTSPSSTGPTPVPWGHVIALGIITNIAAQFGDLFESALKRDAGVKDSGTLLPGHGGLLDRIDALLFAVPSVVFYQSIVEFLMSSIRT